MKKYFGRHPLMIPLTIGVLFRLVLFFVSVGNNGYFGGDEKKYIGIAEGLLRGEYSPSAILPPGYPFSVAVSLKLFNAYWPLGLFNILVFVFFTLWVHSKLQEKSYKRASVLIPYFLIFDPVWICQTIILGADFQGAILYGIVFLNIGLAKITNLSFKKIFLLGCVLAWAAMLKPVYIFMPLFFFGFFLVDGGFGENFKKILMARFAIFVLGWLVVCGPFLTYRWTNTHGLAISEHNSQNFGRYAVGGILVTKGLASDQETGMKMADSKRGMDPALASQMTWDRYALTMIFQNPRIFIKNWSLNIYKTVFGQTNLPFLRLFKGNTAIEGPGIWIQLARQGGLFSKLSSLSWGWLLGTLLLLGEKLILVTLAILGARKMWRQKLRLQMVTIIIMAVYFAVTPFAFGDPRYFLQGTLNLLLLSGYLWV